MFPERQNRGLYSGQPIDTHAVPESEYGAAASELVFEHRHDSSQAGGLLSPRLQRLGGIRVSFDFVDRAADPLENSITTYHPHLVEFYAELRAIAGGIGVERRAHRILRELLSIPAIDDSVLRGHISIAVPGSFATASLSPQITAFRDVIKESRSAELYPFGGPDEAYLAAVNELIETIDAAARKHLTIPAAASDSVVIAAGTNSLEVTDITVKRPSRLEKIFTLGSAFAFVEELHGVGTGIFARVDSFEGLALKITDFVRTSGGNIDYLWEGDWYSGNLRPAAITPRPLGEPHPYPERI